MPDAFRQSVIRTLINEIAVLSGGRFEQFGYRMMGIIHTGQWVERGTTVEAAPRGYTVDTSSDGASLVAEMSSEHDYFHGDMVKPKRDLAHALVLHPDVKRIWLLSSREATAGETTNCANLETNFVQQNDSLTKIEILDARKIAEYIFGNLEVERFVGALIAYLPSVGRIADENAFSHRVPVYWGYQYRSALEDSVVDRLENYSYAVVSGISGIGKSALVAQVAERLRSTFDIIIWLDACGLSNINELSDVDIGRVGTHHNISGLLRRHKCLLILDDALLSWEQIAQSNFGESRVVLTCQATSAPDRIEVGEIDQGTARILLQEGVLSPCPEEIFQRVYLSIGGYPLLLGALNRLARTEGWEAVDDCCHNAASSIEDERHNKVCQRILTRHKESLAKELEFVKWCGVSRFDYELASICVSARAVKNLQMRAFLAATASGDIRVHDVVYQSILAVIDVSAESAAFFSDRLDNFIRAEFDNEKNLLRRVVNLHAPLLIQLLTKDPRPSFIYSVALARPNYTPLELLGNPVATSKTIAAAGSWDGKEIEIRAVIEAVEALYTITSANYGTTAAQASLKENITALEVLLSCPMAKDELLRDLKHHYAKMLIRLQKASEAEAEFRAILAEYPEFAAGRLQLARILSKNMRKEEALAESTLIINQHIENQLPVSSPIIIEALRLVATLGTVENIRPFETLIISILKNAREFERELILRLMASVAQKTWYTMPELVTSMFKSIEWRDAAPASDSERSDWAQAHKSVAKATDIKDPQRHDFLLAADETYKSIKKPSSYQMVQHAESLILLERFDEANAILDQVPDINRDSFWWQRRSQSFLGLKRADVALEAINNSLSKLKNRTYISAFLHDRFRARKSLGDDKAEEDLLDAISNLPEDDKFRKELEAELADLS